MSAAAQKRIGAPLVNAAAPHKALLLMRALLCLLALLPLANCSMLGLDRSGGSGNDLEDVYSYTGYDEDGQAVVTGTLYVVFVPSDVADEPDRFTGRWALDATSERVGPQDGEGTLEGTVQGDTFDINLNPGMADDNVYLHGRLEDEGARMTGEWSYATFVGPTAGGRFEAERVRRATQHHVGG